MRHDLTTQAVIALVRSCEGSAVADQLQAMIEGEPRSEQNANAVQCILDRLDTWGSHSGEVANRCREISELVADQSEDEECFAE